MTVIDRHEWRLYEEFEPDTVYPIIDGTVDLDDEWDPLTQGRLTTATEPPNPLGTPVPLMLELYQSVGPEFQHTRDLTDMFGGTTTADITTRWGGLTGAEVSALYRRTWSSTSLSPTSRRLKLYAKTREQNPDGTWTITVESNSMRLNEFVTSIPRDLAASTVSAALRALLAEEFDLAISDLLTVIDDGPIPIGMSATYPTEPRVPMEAGDRIIDALASSLQANNLRIVDFGDGPVLIDADWQNANPVALSDTVSVIDSATVADREQWFERLVVIYSKDKTNPSIPYYGATRGSGVFPPATSILKTRQIEINAAAPFVSSSQADIDRVLIPIADRLRNQGTSTRVDAVARYDAFPRAAVTVTDSAATLTGTASRVTFTLSTRTMQLDLRQVVAS